MNVEDCATYALARAAEFSEHYPKSRALIYRRIGLRQAALMAAASQLTQDLFGVCAVTTLTDGAADVSAIVAPVPTPAAIQRVEVTDPGTSGYAAGTPVDLVPLADPDAGLAPRMTFRDGVLRGWGSEMDLVTTITIYYARRPPLYAATDGALDVELPSPHDELLVIDAAKWLAGAATDLSPDARAAILQTLAAEEAPLVTAWLEYARSYSPTRSRFSAPPEGLTPRTP